MTNLQRFALVRWLIFGALLFVGFMLLRPAHGDDTVEDLRKTLAPLPAASKVRIDGKPVKVEPAGGVVTLKGEAAPEPDPPTPSGNALGDFALQPGSDDVQPANSGRRISEAQLRYSGIDGVTLRARPHWDYIAFYRSCLERTAKTGDKATLLLMGGGSATPWIESNVKAYEAAAAKMGAAFANHPSVVGVHITGCSPQGVSEELHFKPADNRGYIAANKRLIDAWAKAFPRQTLLLAIGGGDPAGMNAIIDYGLAKYPGRLLVKNNSMKAGTTLTASHNRIVVEAGKRGAMIGWEMVGSTKEARFGGDYAKMFDNVDTLTKQAGKAVGQRYLAHYPPDLEKLK